MSVSEVFILGNFGYVTNQLDGQTMESRTLVELLKMKNVQSYDYFDTQELHFKRSSALIMFKKLIKTRRLFFLGAQRSLKYLFPIVWFITKIFGIKFHFFVVGGWIAEYINNMPIHKYLLRKIDGMYCETVSIANKLTNLYDYSHVYWFPNFRIYNFEPEIILKHEDPLKLVFMSRITKSKGYPIVFRMAEEVQNRLPNNSVIIDFYGPIYPDDKADFLKGLSKFDFAEYKGILQPEDIYTTLTKYDAMLFPTSYKGEGFPGTILDSYISGIPVIASDWRYNSELIRNNQTGFIFDLSDEEEFYKYIIKLYHDRDLLFRLKIDAHKKSKEFDHNTVWDIITRRTGLTSEIITDE